MDESGSSRGLTPRSGYAGLRDREDVLTSLNEVIAAAWESFERPRPEEPGLDADLEARLACLDRCLAELPAETRELVLRYYRGEGGAKIEERRMLSIQLGVGAANLRIRLHRLRLRLESCVTKCMGRETSRPLPPPSSEDGEQ